MPDGTVGGDRRVCRSDFEHAYIYDSGAGGEQDTITGTTMFSLSRDAYRELKARGETRHRNVSFYEGAMVADMRGTVSAAYLLVITFIGLALGPYTVGRLSEATGDLRLALIVSLAAGFAGVVLLALAARYVRVDAAK